MGRKYTQKDLQRLFSDIRTQIPEVALRTTVMVGFPGETDREFKQLMDFIEVLQFDHLGVFIYSDAQDLSSHKLSGHVSRRVAQKRHDLLMSCQLKISLKNNHRHVDQTYTVLVEKKIEDNLYCGRTAFQAPEVDGLTYIHSKHLQLGAFYDVKIRDALEYDLIGETV
jgi:ribosomal protein S12 methylthiotransferase